MLFPFTAILRQVCDMARIRSIKPTFWSSEPICALSRDARLLFIGLWNYCDDYGRGVDNHRLIAADVFPLDDDLAPDDVADLMDELELHGRICRYVVDGRRYFEIPRWDEHQKISNKTHSPIPPPNDSEPAAEIPTDSEPLADSGRDSEKVLLDRKGREGIGEENASSAEADLGDDGFEAFWRGYPLRNGRKGSKRDAHTVWKRLSVAKRAAAMEALPAHSAASSGPFGQYPVDAVRWLRRERWLECEVVPLSASDGPEFDPLARPRPSEYVPTADVEPEERERVLALIRERRSQRGVAS